ncbi:MAG: hypothetical protein K2Y28_12650 [Burkholderiaceae bacterium]|nr:hypothetical protein [Burkholderiaceae bacterium]
MNEKRKLGRPLKLAPADAAERIRELAANGHSLLGVAVGLGTSIATFQRWIDVDANLKIAFDEGREKERHTLHTMLYNSAIKGGNTTAAIFLLKARHSYKEGDQAESGNRISINFTLPGAMSMQEFGVFENEASNPDESIPAKSIIVTRGG